jgi:flavorubredoxin
MNDLIKKITAPNGGVFTGQGTNSYLIGKEDITLIDPGSYKKNSCHPYSQRSFSCSITNFKRIKYSNVWKVG